MADVDQVPTRAGQPIERLEDRAVLEIFAGRLGFVEHALRNEQQRGRVAVPGRLGQSPVEVGDPRPGFPPHQIIEPAMQRLVQVVSGLHDGTAIGRSERPAQDPRRIGALRRALQQVRQRVALDVHGTGEHRVAVLNFLAQFLVGRAFDVEVHELERPLVLRHERREGEQPERRKRGFPPDVLHHVLVTPEGVGWEFRRDQQSFFDRHGSFPLRPAGISKGRDVSSSHLSVTRKAAQPAGASFFSASAPLCNFIDSNYAFIHESSIRRSVSVKNPCSVAAFEVTSTPPALAKGVADTLRF